MQKELIAQHRECDTLFAELESAIHAQSNPNEAFEKFKHEVLKHFDLEEQKLFPAFESKTGMRAGPTQVMRSEHAQIRALIDEMQANLSHGQQENFFSLAETLLIMTQQHNMKEENILYPMCAAHLGEDFLNE